MSDPVINNNKYTTALEIASRIARVHKSKQIDVSDAIEWCAECETEYIGETAGLMLYKKVKLPVSNLMALQPCNVYRLLDVYLDVENSQSRVSFYDDGTYIKLDDSMNYLKELYVNYYGIAVDECTGLPLIKKGHEQACESFILIKLYHEDYLQGKLDQNRWNDLQQDLANKLMSFSTFRHMSRNEMQRINQIQANIAQRIGNIPLFQID